MSKDSILSAWLHPLKVKEFLDRYWTHEACNTEADTQRLQFTTDLLPGTDLVTLLDYAMDPIKVWYLDGNVPVYSLSLSKKQALHGYRAGLTLYFHLDPVISGKIIAELSRDLSRPPLQFKVSIFAGRKGARTMPHFDGNQNFTVQLSGTKRWKISPGQEWPGMEEKKKKQLLKSNLIRALLPPESWSEAQMIEMSAGASLYCPAPFWHTVETLEDSISLNVSIMETFTWADTLLPMIRSVLISKENWLDLEIGLWSSGNRRQQAEKLLSTLLERLSKDLENINPDDFLASWDAADREAPENIPTNFVRNPLVVCELISAKLDSEFKVRVESSVRKSVTNTLTFQWKYYVSFLDLMTESRVRQSDEFRDATELLNALLRCGVLRSCS